MKNVTVIFYLSSAVVIHWVNLCVTKTDHTPYLVKDKKKGTEIKQIQCRLKAKGTQQNLYPNLHGVCVCYIDIHHKGKITYSIPLYVNKQNRLLADVKFN